MPAARVVVVGGGISGLAACWELTGGAQGPAPGSPEVVLVEASSRLGGPLRSAPFAQRIVDLGPDGFLGRRPEAVELCREAGLGDALVPIVGRGASVWARGKLRTLPEGLALGIPTHYRPVARSGVLSLRGKLGLVRDAVIPRPDLRRPIGDRAIGPLVARKLGQRVVDVLVDPLIGGIHAGSTDDMSAAATYPPLLSAAQRKGSLMRALRAEVPAPSDDAPPLFWSLQGGMELLAQQLATVLRARGVTIRLDTPVRELERGDGWRVVTDADSTTADAIVLAVPAHTSGPLLQAHDGEAAGLLTSIDHASVTLVTFRLAPNQLPSSLQGTGFLVPRHSPVPRGAAPLAITACTYLSNKWTHMAGDGDVILRASLGRFGDRRAEEWDDAEVAERAWAELSTMLGGTDGPLESLVTRWPRSFPQYRVHHPLRVSGIESAVARLGGVSVAGAALRGVGIPACIASGRAAARAHL